ncbi:MAG TPA: hypothetical protein VF668_07830 [Pyrinomonadaceae bacterium]
MKQLVIVALSLFPALSLPQEISPAEKFRTTKEFQKVLSLFKESQLVATPNRDAEVYRVFIAPTFYHPMSIRIEKNADGYFLSAKRLSGQGGYEWGTLKGEKRRRLSEREWRTLLNLMNEASFWASPTEEKEAGPNEKGEETICLDSTSWTLEGVSGGKYHVVYRYCPEMKGIKTVGLYMARLTKWGIKEIDLR